MRCRTSLFTPRITVWTNRPYPCLSTGTGTIPQQLQRLQICFPYTPVPRWCLEALWVIKSGSVNNENQIMAMVNASHLPTAIEVVHFRSHKTDDFIVSSGNDWADKAARSEAPREVDFSHPPHDILTLQTESPPETLVKVCPKFINSFSLTGQSCLPIGRDYRHWRNV